MNTSQLKRFAKEARVKLLEQVKIKLEYVLTQDTAELRGKEKQINALRDKIAKSSKEHVIDIVAYTWFNRFIALRFMDANGYTSPKVVTPLNGMTNPEILQNALGSHVSSELKLDIQRLNDIINGKTAVVNVQAEAYKMLLIAACNYWNKAMPFMFEPINDYTELLLPDDLLSDFSIVTDIRNGLTEEDCKQEEIIGWLYQFYISDKKDEVFAGLKKNKKITPQNIPAATQLFTPHWIVRYMVENTLGKIWLTFKPDSNLREHMKYFIEAPEGSPPAPLPEGINGVTDITFLDPCQGSGHVLVYAFELFSKIYEEEGYNQHEIAELILKNNLFGIDIDERATQLAAFALTMKARKYYNRFLVRPTHPNVIALESVDEETIRESVSLPLRVKGVKYSRHKDLSLQLLTKADNFGSLIKIEPEEAISIEIEVGSIWEEQQKRLFEQAEYLSRQYHCVVTNPPYMGQRSMNVELKMFVENYFERSKSDLMACFMERCIAFSSINGKTGMINQNSWMFLSSYEEMRLLFLDTCQFETMLHLGPRTFPEIGGEVVQSTSFTFGKYNPTSGGIYFRLIDFNSSQLKEDRTIEAIKNTACEWCFIANQKDFQKIPGNPIGYWLSKSLINSFDNDRFEVHGNPKVGMQTANNNKFLRLWFEVNSNEFNSSLNNPKWIKYLKGGSFRRWYGNLDYLLFYNYSGNSLRAQKNATLLPLEYLSTLKCTWTDLASNKFNCRYAPIDTFHDISGHCFFPSQKKLYQLLALSNSKYFQSVIELLNPTLHYQVGDVKKIPVNTRLLNNHRLKELSEACVNISKLDWDIHEKSWDFTNNVLVIQKQRTVKMAFELFRERWTGFFYELHRNEEDINRLVIEIYGLSDEFNANVPLYEITILQEEAKIINDELFIDPVSVLFQFLSYSIGCLFGRYSLDKPGLILANQGESLQNFLKQVPNPTFTPDEDNILPVMEGEWFADDIVGRFKEFLKVAFGDKHFEENLKYIQDTIGKDIRKYFVKDFYDDHIKRYKKRPIYWMFSSPKGHFRTLIYMHRYQPDLCNKILNNYLHAFIGKLEAKKQAETTQSLSEDISAREKASALKEIDKLDSMLKDCRDFERKLFSIATKKISIDLDDGVKVNYQKFKDVLVPIKGLEKEE